MGAVPRKKLTRARQGRRLAAYKLKPQQAAQCPRCRSAKRPHAACPTCGYYRGRLVVDRQS
jgi:large subunit ribosomal protein L32